MRPYPGMLLAATLCIAGCASIPLSTMLSASSMSPQSLGQVDPAQVRVRLSVPRGFEVDVPATHLTLSVENPAANRAGQLDLKALTVVSDNRPRGLLASDLPVTTYLFTLTPGAQAEFRSLQQVLLGMDHGTIQAGFKANFSKRPPGADDIVFWVDLRLSDSEPFMPLLDEAKVSFEDA